jgi:hypothetical protein
MNSVMADMQLLAFGKLVSMNLAHTSWKKKVHLSLFCGAATLQYFKNHSSNNVFILKWQYISQIFQDLNGSSINVNQTFNMNITCKVFPLENINIFKKFKSQFNIFFFILVTTKSSMKHEPLKLCFSNNLYLCRTKPVSQFKNFC